MKIIAQYESGKMAMHSTFNLDIAPQVGDTIRTTGAALKVVRRRFADILAPDVGVDPREWVLLLTVEEIEDPEPLPVTVTEEQ